MSHSHNHSHHTHTHTATPLKIKLINICVSGLILLISPFVISHMSSTSIEAIRQIYNAQSGITENKIISGKVSSIRTETEEQDQIGTITTQTITLENTSATIVSKYFSGDRIISLSAGDTIYYSPVLNTSTGETEYNYIDTYRLDTVLWVIIIFVALVIALTGYKGITAFIGLAFSTIIIFNYMLPEILIGSSIIWVTFVSAITIAGISMFISHGFNKPTAVAVLGTFATIGITILISLIVENNLHFTGVSTHELSHLQTFKTLNSKDIDLRSLFLASIILGSLGVLDDVTIAQSYIVHELYHTNSHQSLWKVFTHAMNVGKEHIISLVNTLTLAYFATSLPFIIQFVVYGYSDIFVLINSEVISGEIVRTIIGSVSLFLAIPLTTLCAGYFLHPQFSFKHLYARCKTYLVRSQS